MSGESKLRRVNNADGETLYGYHFQCPGCNTIHTVGARWEFNGDMLRPTFSPSILVTNGSPKYRCHSYLREGRLQFLGDCSHDMAGQTVELGELPDWID
jgi:hypothetical protein